MLRSMATTRICDFCRQPFQRRDGRPAGKSGFACHSKECRRAWQAKRLRIYAAEKRAEGVDIYAPHRAKAQAARRARIAAGERLPTRKLYPEAAARGDMARRARKAATAEREPFTRDEIGDRDGWICGLCGEPIDHSLAYPHPRSPSVDHVIPLAAGGPHTRSNVQIAHLGENVAKGARQAG